MRSIPKCGRIPQRRYVPQVHAAIAEAPGDSALLGGEFEEEGPALIGRSGLLLRDGEQFVGDFDAGDAAGVEEAGHASRQDEDVGDDRNVEAVQGMYLSSSSCLRAS